MTEKFEKNYLLANSYMNDRAYYEQLGKDIATIIKRSVSETQLQDIQTELLMLAIHRQPLDMPTHIKALLIQLLSVLQSGLNDFKKDTLPDDPASPAP